MSAPEHHESTQAEALFDALLRTTPENAVPDIDVLCVARPDLAPEFRALRAAYARGSGAIKALRWDAGVANVSAKEGRYAVRAHVALGGMGSILEVWDEELRRSLAMKVLRDRTDDAQPAPRLGLARRRSRLLNEAQVLAQLDHPGIVPVHEVGCNEQGELFFTMQLVRGRTLAELVPLVRSDAEEWPLTRAVAVVQRACEAVAYAHSKGVVHRDLKPQNMMVGRFGEIYVMDWGLAKAKGIRAAADIRLREVRVNGGPGAEREGDGAALSKRSVRTDRRDAFDEAACSPLQTLDGDVVGTPAYMSPEQADGRLELVDERSDVYGMGATLYHLLAGEMPYLGETTRDPHAILRAVRIGELPRLGRLAPDAPPELVAVCEKAMARDREQRYPSMKDLADDLRAWLEGRVVHAHRTGTWMQLRKWATRHRLATTLMTLLALVVSSSSVVFAVLYRKSEELRVAEITLRGNAIRRGIISPNAYGGPPLPSLVDEFDRGWLDRRWIVPTGLERVRFDRGRVCMTTSAAEPVSLELDPMVNVLVGDFDIEVDYTLVDFDVHPVPRSEHLVAMSVFDPKETGRPLGAHRQVGHVLDISRHAEYRSAVTPGVEQTCRASDWSGRFEFVEQDSTQGRFRLRREGERITALTWQDGWVELLSSDCTDRDLGLRLTCRDYYLDDPAVFQIERITARTRARPLTAVVNSVTEDFSSPTMTPELRLGLMSGAAAVVDGRMRMWKVEGQPGDVDLFLDHHRGHVLRGDFDVSLLFELEDFPIPRRGFAELQLQVFTRAGERFGTIRVIARDGRIEYGAFYHAEAREIPFEGPSGGLRLHRRGTRLEFLYRAEAEDEWRLLLERPDINGEPDMVFAIRLLSDAEEGCVVLIDDIAVTSTPWPESRPPR